MSSASNKENDLGLDRLDIDDLPPVRIVVAPHVQHRLLVVMSPSVSVIPVRSVRRPPESETGTKRLLGDPNVDGRLVDAHDIKLRLVRRGAS
jgi:hypothetical protein